MSSRSYHLAQVLGALGRDTQRVNFRMAENALELLLAGLDKGPDGVFEPVTRRFALAGGEFGEGTEISAPILTLIPMPSLGLSYVDYDLALQVERLEFSKLVPSRLFCQHARKGAKQLTVRLRIRRLPIHEGICQLQDRLGF